MSLPDLLAGAVDGEDVVASVPLGGDDTLAVTPTRTLVYRAEGLLSGETIEEYSHEAEAIDISEGRRKTKITLDHGLDGEETLTIPSSHADDVLHHVLAGVLAANGVADVDESAIRTFRFSELTLVVTDKRLVKHIGPGVWDAEYEEFHYEDVRDLDFEEGTVATSIVLTLDDRQERFKAPNESARQVKETLTDVVCAYYDVESLEEFRLTRDDEANESADGDPTDFGNGPDPLSASPAADSETDPDASDVPGVDGERGDTTSSTTTESDRNTAITQSSGATEARAEPDAKIEPDAGSEPAEGPGSDSGIDDQDAGSVTPETTSPKRQTEGPDPFEDSPFETPGVEGEDLAEEVVALRETVETQSERIERQSELIEQLIAELRRGR